MIEFKKIESESTFLDPRKGFAPTTVRFQVRIDPLTGRTCHFSHFGAIKPQKLDLAGYHKPAVKGFCPFCAEQREKATPKFTPEVVPEGRLARGEALLIPNLFPYDVHSGVVVMTDDHVVGLRDLTKERLRDAFSLGMDFLRRIAALDTSLPYHLMTWNYMPPSGGGLVHPHQQYFATAYPGNQFMDELSASHDFAGRHGENYWYALAKQEAADNVRYIARIGSGYWLAPFVSLGLLGEVLCVFPDVFSIHDLSSDDIDNLVAGLERLFRYYEDAGVFSFNASFSFGPPHQEHFSAYFRIVPRTFLNTRDFAPDLNFFQAILSEPICVVLPEDLCREIKPYFK
ncbi:MAG: hypothetical protein PHC90_02640 [Syntrophorhabdaceae bacterium]|nr:hypothetical protein [Syntrophorhabdaceae bacterium]